MDIQGECDSFRAEVWVPVQCLKDTGLVSASWEAYDPDVG